MLTGVSGVVPRVLVASGEKLFLSLLGCSDGPVTFSLPKQMFSRMGGAIRRLFCRCQEVEKVSMVCWLETTGWLSGRRTSGAAVRYWFSSG